MEDQPIKLSIVRKVKRSPEEIELIKKDAEKRDPFRRDDMHKIEVDLYKEKILDVEITQDQFDKIRKAVIDVF